MPGVLPPNDDWANFTLADLIDRVRALETQQQAYITNSLGQPVLIVGLSPGSNPPTYGYQLVNPSTGAPIALFGVDASGAPSLKFFDANGNQRLQLGELSNGDYGLAAYSSADDGTYQELQPTYSSTVYVNDYMPAAPNPTQTNPAVPFTPSPSITCRIGATGRFLATMSAGMITYKTVAGLYLYTDGAAQIDPTGNAVTVGCGDPTETIEFESSVSYTGVLTTTPGVHTFTMECNDGGGPSGLGGNVCTLYGVTLTIQPL